MPLGAFLVEHLWANASVLGGRVPYDRTVAELQRLPVLPLLELIGIFLPLGFHVIYGVVLAREPKQNLGSDGYARHWLQRAQRVTGLIALVFLLAHLWEFRVQKWLFSMAPTNFYDVMESHMSWTKWGVPWIAIGYLIGVGATVSYFANSLFQFGVSWGWVKSLRAQKRLVLASASVGAFLFVLGALTVMSMASGSSFGLGRSMTAPALTDCKGQGTAPAH